MTKILFLLVILLCISCGEHISSNNEFGENREEEEQDLPDFSTRLTNTLLISGARCRGGETAQAEGEIFVCDSSQWLFVIDNINSCTPEGCTTIEVPGIIGGLEASTSSGSVVFYDINPSMPITNEVSNIIQSVTVKFGNFSAPQVIFK